MNVAELQRQVEHKFAPQPLLAVQALVNTFAFDTEEERLLDPQSAREWLLESELAKPGVRVSRGQWQRLREFREVLRGLMDANLGVTPARQAATELARFTAEYPVALGAGPDGTLGLELDPVDSVDELIAQFVGIVFQAQLTDQWPRLKICASDECRWAFYDSSRNRGGTWCQMEVCGNRIKNRAYRQRKAAT